MRKNAQIITLLARASINAFEGALMGASVGTALSLFVAGIVWYAHGGIYWGLPASQDIAFCMGMGLLEGALAGAMLSLGECAVKRNFCRSR